MTGYVKLPTAAPAAPAPAPAAGGGSLTVNKNLLMVGGLVVVAVIALVNSRKGSSSDTTGTAADYNIDTTSTDLYNDLQPELETIGDQLARLNNPAPAVPPVVPPSKPGTPKPAPKPQAPRGYVRYIVKTGDTLAKVAAAYHTTAANLYAWNKGTIDQAAAKHGRKTYGAATVIWPGSVLTIRIDQPGQRGVKLGF